MFVGKHREDKMNVKKIRKINFNTYRHLDIIKVFDTPSVKLQYNGQQFQLHFLSSILLFWRKERVVNHLMYNFVLEKNINN